MRTARRRDDGDQAITLDDRIATGPFDVNNACEWFTESFHGHGSRGGVKKVSLRRQVRSDESPQAREVYECGHIQRRRKGRAPTLDLVLVKSRHTLIGHRLDHDYCRTSFRTLSTSAGL